MGNCHNVPDDGDKRNSKMKGKPQVIIKAFTWTRDSHGLFDYECKNLTKKNLKVVNPAKLTRGDNEINMVKDLDGPVSKNSKELIKLSLKEGNFWVNTALDFKSKKDDKLVPSEEDWDKIDNSVWLVVKTFRATAANRLGYKLTEGELIKLGRVKFRIREARMTASSAISSSKTVSNKPEGGNVVATSLNKIDEPSRVENVPKSEKSLGGVAYACRICLGETEEPGNPFVTPCKCAGTMRFIHVICLQHWLKSKLHVKQSANATSFYWKSLECELCKEQYPNIIEVKNKKYDMILIDKPTDSPYLILDILNKEKNVTKGVHVIKMEPGKPSIKLGRGHDSDIRITDISVSRCHAMIKLEKTGFYLEDNNSKFGTLVHLKKSFPIFGDYNNISIQVGRTVMALSVKKNWKILPACFSNTDNNNTSGDERDSDGGDEAVNPVIEHRAAPNDQAVPENDPEVDDVLNQLDNDNDEEDFSPVVNEVQAGGNNVANPNPDANANANQPNQPPVNQNANPNNVNNQPANNEPQH